MSRKLGAAGMAMSMLGACGRIAFDLDGDARTDGLVPCPAVHDEDNDGIDDACDVCPHVTDISQADQDGDHVGDACDPNPATPTESITVFDPFTEQRDDLWVFTHPPTFMNNQLIYDARPQSMSGYLIGPAPATDLYILSGRVGAGDPTGSRQLTITLTAGTSTIYYCQLLDNNVGGEYFALTYTYDGAMYTDIDVTTSTRLENGPMFLRVQNAPTSVSCSTNWPATQQSVGGTQPGDITPVEMFFRVDGVEIFYDYFVQIHTD